MRKSVLILLSVAVSLGLFSASAALADTPKPLVVMSMASYDALVDDSGSVKAVADVDKMPTWMQSMIRLFAEGNQLAGLDATKPWGAVIQLKDGKLGAYGFVPVSDPETLRDELSDYIASAVEWGYGVYKVDGTEAGKSLYAKPTDCGYIIVSDKSATLDDAPADPAKLLEGLDKQYDFAIRINTCNIPADHGRNMLRKIRSELDKNYGLSGMVPEQTLQILGAAAWELDQITLGWTKHSSK